MIVYWISLVLALFLNAFSNIAVKVGAIKSSKIFILIGLLGFGIQFMFYAFALKKINLSIAYPIMVGCGFMIIGIYSHIFLKEHISIFGILGMILIVIGVAFVSFKSI